MEKYGEMDSDNEIESRGSPNEEQPINYIQYEAKFKKSSVSNDKNSARTNEYNKYCYIGITIIMRVRMR